MTGVALTGPLAGEYGQPSVEKIVEVLGLQRTYHSQQVPVIKKNRQETRRMGAVAPKGKGILPV